MSAMLPEAEDRGRRRFLIAGTSTLIAAGAATTAVPFLSYWRPTAAATLASLPVRIDLSKLGDGEGVKILWRGSPMWIVRRPSVAVAQLSALRDRLKDPDSIASEQPVYAANAVRARRDDISVLTALCTHLGCIPDLRSKGNDELGADLDGGFYCPCHGSRFDIAGRVLKGSPAPTNLPVPAHHFPDANTLVVGADEAET